VVDHVGVNNTMRSVPLAYAELVSAINNDVFPHERHWIDFKRRLYPEETGDGKPGQATRDKVNEELARDMASMAERGGFLVYGVKENKASHTFSVDEMPLPVGLHETVDQVARDRITPPLSGVPTPVPNPDGPSKGFLVVEIPESPDSPHMADHTYWGRSETGRVRLRDDQVERLMLQRSRYGDQLQEAIRATVDVDSVPTKERTVCHFYFTAVPTRWWPDMFAGYSRNKASRSQLLQLCTDLTNKIAKAGLQTRDWERIAFAGAINDYRTQQVAAGWLGTWAGPATEGAGRTIGVDDNGPIRYINLAAGGRPPGWTADVVYEGVLLAQTADMIRLVAALSNEISYSGSWLLGVHLDRLRGLVSQLGTERYNADAYTETTRATGLSIRDEPEAVAAKLMRGLLRGLGSEARWLSTATLTTSG
jgi:hypothetical protein